MKHVVMFSGGIGSWAAAKRVAAQHGTENLTLLFTDTLMEDQDLYRFLVEGAADVFGIPYDRVGPLAIRARQLPDIDRPEERSGALAYFRAEATRLVPGLVWIAEGRDPWQVFFDRRFLGNSRRDPCSAVLKRKVAEKWRNSNCDPNDTTCYVGIDWSEEHRFTSIRERHGAKGWRYEAPMCEPEHLTKPQMFALLASANIPLPRLYKQGFAHNNCAAFCVKAGVAHYALLLKTMPDRFRFHEQKEQEFRAFIGKDRAILRDRSGGKSRPLPLAELRQRLERGEQYDLFDIGGCGCFSEPEAAP